ncbi:hypothetical protein PPERSA_00422 [Pseudocohnilembus persalinus]|uniref:Uncharacterized protein n=1 Tax=Pseudocohnilembus persalinus TaxID=266149 RepID=A0A0V0Q9I0_PSEPJ|nr:hypothetical protein PPERSA_00422 [Pseudocohnilembus persalinus]|eukprot:KRW98833.1 hypothetical protein PPERSA_00422 [Pseudocohnilembus persalinus]
MADQEVVQKQEQSNQGQEDLTSKVLVSNDKNEKKNEINNNSDSIKIEQDIKTQQKQNLETNVDVINKTSQIQAKVIEGDNEVEQSSEIPENEIDNKLLLKQKSSDCPIVSDENSHHIPDQNSQNKPKDDDWKKDQSKEKESELKQIQKENEEQVQQQQQHQDEEEKQKIINQTRLQQKNEEIKNIKSKAIKNNEDLMNFQMNYLKQHYYIGNLLRKQLLLKQELSVYFITQILHFFQFRKNQEQNYLKNVNPNGPQMQQFFVDPKIEHKQYFPKLNDILVKADSVNKNRDKKIQDFVDCIQKVIIDENIMPEIKSYEKQLKNFNDNIQKAENQLKKQEKEYNDRLKKFQKIQETQFLQTENQQLKDKKDLFNQEQKFKKMLLQLSNSHRLYGYEVMKFYETLQKLEFQRIKKVQSWILQYIELNQRTFEKTPEQDIIEKQLQELDLFEQSQQQHLPQELLSSEIVQQIKSFTGIPDNECLKFDHLHFFMYNFKLPHIDLDHGKHQLVKKTFLGYIDQGTFSTTWKKIQILITIDDFLQIFYDDTLNVTQMKDQKQPFTTENCDKSAVQYLIPYIQLRLFKKDPTKLEIKEVQPGLIFDSTNKIAIKFDSIDKLQEFQNYFTANYGEEIYKGKI